MENASKFSKLVSVLRARFKPWCLWLHLEGSLKDQEEEKK
jgi:hypothetical protein